MNSRGIIRQIKGYKILGTCLDKNIIYIVDYFNTLFSTLERNDTEYQKDGTCYIRISDDYKCIQFSHFIFRKVLSWYDGLYNKDIAEILRYLFCEYFNLHDYKIDVDEYYFYDEIT